MEKEQNKNQYINPKKKKLLGATALVAGASLAAGAYFGVSSNRTEASPQDSLKPEKQTTHVSEAPSVDVTPEAEASEEAYDADIIVEVGDDDTIDEVAETYYPDLNQETVVDSIEAANPDKDPDVFNTWGTVTVPGTVDGYLAMSQKDGSGLNE